MKRQFTKDIIGSVYDSVSWKKRDAVITGADGSIVFEQKDVEFPSRFSQQAVNITVQKYFRGKLGTPGREQSFHQMVSRVVDTITKWGLNKYFDEESAEIFRDELAYLILHQMMAFNSPVWFNVGIEEHPQCSACFINSVEDSMESILELAKTEGMLFKYGSGTGSNLSNLRSSRESLNGGGTSSGPVSFMRGFDAFAGAIKSGGKTRRAAKMVILDVDHPDIVDFITCKANEEKKAHALVEAGFSHEFNVRGGAYESIGYQNANHSVRVSDAFMRAVDEDLEWCTRNVLDDQVADTYKARDLMRQIAEAAHLCGDPGMQFDTTINSWHTCSGTAPINASNPCCFVGETLVETSEGRIRIDELARMSDAGETLPLVFAWDEENNLPVLRQIKKAWKSGKTTQLVRIVTDKGIELVCTPDHRFLLFNGSWTPAKALKRGVCLRDIFIEGLTHDRVESCEPFTMPSTQEVSVYDLEVDGVHNFSVTHPDAPHGIIVHNSEYMFLDDSACNLASLNLRSFQRADGEINVEAYKHAIEITIMAMEIIVDNSSYPTTRITENSHRFRPLGLGYANLGAFLMARGVPYDSDEGRAYAATLTALLCGHAYRTSAKLAGVVGAFDGYKENKDSFMKVMRRHQQAIQTIDARLVSTHLIQAVHDSWNAVVTYGAEHGFRNSQTTVLAPTGTIAFLMDCDTTGVEPDTALVKYKRLVGGGMIKIINQSVSEGLYRLNYNDAQVRAIIDYIDQEETIEGAPSLKDEHLPIFDCAFRPDNGSHSIHYMGHIRMMAAVQPFLSGAISKTVNMPYDCTVADIEDAYMKAWRLGLKAIAVYRDGCKKSQPVSTKKGDSTTSQEETNSHPVRRRLPNERAGWTCKFTVGGHEGYLTVGLYDDGTPGEIFIRMAKEGSTISGLLDAFATAISLALQHNVSLEHLCAKFKGSRFEPSGFTGNEDIPLATSIIDYIFRWLENKFLNSAPVAQVPETSSVKAMTSNGTYTVPSDVPTCSDCGTLMTRSGACHRCDNCGTTSGCS